jgi:lactate dehydrogenase-like 2-hydroxyacid dehydrogenase
LLPPTRASEPGLAELRDLDRPELLLVGPLPAALIDEIAREVVVHRLWTIRDKGSFLKAHADRITLVATNGRQGCSAAIIEALPHLELVASFGVGYDAIDLAAARGRSIRVTNTPEVPNDGVAEMTVALMLALCHRIPQAHDYVRRGLWPRGSFPLTQQLTGGTAGILGLGRIGKKVARLLQAFQMQVVYHGRHHQESEPFRYYADLAVMAGDVDWLVVMAPASPSTRGIVSRTVMEALGPRGTLVNTARGSLVDEEAMIEMLASGALGAAALDVFARSPDVPAALRVLPNVLLSPHRASATHEIRAAMGALLLANLKAHLRGDPLPSAVL